MVRRAKHGGHCLGRISLAAHTITLRPRIVPPLPSSSFGNLQSRVTTRFVPAGSDASGDTPSPELKDLVGLLMDSLTKSKERVVVCIPYGAKIKE